ncbi:MAG: 1-deoxy-D-xylulose-5-phosphate reductoisomerase [Chlamydiae bacterium]|nr:1-deoxy-D-xylulose-5-phosphate reductoisomerase [Chlamydiota bacterium]MBI3265769.1 1-deoxy-D-xylulose-5-phosphate reductoisomerase [Chlamydiota bacterium]
MTKQEDLNGVKGVSILGSTGSIGKNTLEVIHHFPDHFKVVGLAAKSNIDLLEEQVRTFKPQVVAVEDVEKARVLKDRLHDLAKSGRNSVEVMAGPEGMKSVACHDETQMVLSAMVGAAGLIPTLEAVHVKKRVLLANKEVLVMAGELFVSEVGKRGSEMIPVDSEHSAIFQCIEGGTKQEVAKIILTASGGPFLHKETSELEKVTVEEALQHPNWKMGPKITVDSATMMNKGLELIEAYWLFGLPENQIQILIHPQSIVHSMVEFVDGSVLAQLGVPDMKLPIQYALCYPTRLNGSSPRLNLAQVGTLTFKDPDPEKFPALRLARAALQKGGTYPAVLNAANEVAVSKFLQGKIKFLQIAHLVEAVLEKHQDNGSGMTLLEILESDRWAREEALAWKA